MTVVDRYRAKLVTAADAAAQIPSGVQVLVAMGLGAPPAILAAIGDRVRDDLLVDADLYYGIGGDAIRDSILQPGVIEKIRAHTFFVAGYDHHIIADPLRADRESLDFIPVNFSDLPRVITERLDIDTFVVQVSPMDASGHFSFGVVNDYANAAARACRRLIVEVNPHMPRVFGDSLLHIDEVDLVVEHASALPEAVEPAPTVTDRAIAAHVVPHIPDGATLQIGAGRVPTAIGEALVDHRDLGIHSALFSPVFIPLIESGVITGRKKTLHPRRHVWTSAAGDAHMYEFMNDNPSMASFRSSYVNDPHIIAINDAMISVNAAIQVDLYGQVNAEMIGGLQYSGSGGQFDFVTGAARSRGGKSFVVLPATAKGGAISTIVPKVDIVTDERMDVEHIVTENGVVNMRGLSTQQRALALISLADPAHRDDLVAAAKAQHLIA
ncbi:acetyl-CoA hydrolase/transferase C-terminal domain-containing protein [Microbacterium sediminicola]|uniref:Acetyl-CoA hydrolase/transferase C-terminal domain-containing protein n=1 Tax=Microbacterium sediminicola TaxID=415210 RepID=A0ABP4U3N4_9MICO